MKEKVLAFFQNHYADGTLQMLSGELGYAPTYTSNWLKNHMGTTFTEMLQASKCAVAARQTNACGL